MGKRHGILVGGALLILFCTACLFDDIYGTGGGDEGDGTNVPDAGGPRVDAFVPNPVDAGPAGADGGTCVNVNGNWTVTGDCPVTSCTFTQTGCMASLDCHVGINGDVTIMDHMVSVSAGPGTCTLTVDAGGNSMMGSCSDAFGLQNCNLTATRQ